ncbi:MAG: hypothetical protein ACK4ZS_00885 [Sulfurimicrobium sp.]
MRYEEDRAAMLAGGSHDLRTPITRLHLLVELAQGPRSGDSITHAAGKAIAAWGSSSP